MTFVECTDGEHGSAILAILNHAIVTSTALYDYRPRSPEAMHAWFDAKAKCAFPVIGAIDDDGILLGFASYGSFRGWPGYKYTVEHSVYVHHEHRRQGLGRELLSKLIARAGEQGYHVLVGVIDADNRASIHLHEKLGFIHSGTIKHAGFKFGRWLDIVFYQLILPTPSDPADG
jgi:phosphinothricin acetyltransferase